MFKPLQAILVWQTIEKPDQLKKYWAIAIYNDAIEFHKLEVSVIDIAESKHIHRK